MLKIFSVLKGLFSIVLDLLPNTKEEVLFRVKRQFLTHTVFVIRSKPKELLPTLYGLSVVLILFFITLNIAGINILAPDAKLIKLTQDNLNVLALYPLLGAISMDGAKEKLKSVGKALMQYLLIFVSVIAFMAILFDADPAPLLIYWNSPLVAITLPFLVVIMALASFAFILPLTLSFLYRQVFIWCFVRAKNRFNPGDHLIGVVSKICAILGFFSLILR